MPGVCKPGWSITGRNQCCSLFTGWHKIGLKLVTQYIFVQSLHQDNLRSYIWFHSSQICWPLDSSSSSLDCWTYLQKTFSPFIIIISMGERKELSLAQIDDRGGNTDHPRTHLLWALQDGLFCPPLAIYLPAIFISVIERLYLQLLPVADCPHWEQCRNKNYRGKWLVEGKTLIHLKGPATVEGSSAPRGEIYLRHISL